MNLEAQWLTNLAKRLDKGETIDPSPDALRRAASMIPKDNGEQYTGSLICDHCGDACNRTGNGKCLTCYDRDQVLWSAEYSTRMDSSRINIDRLVRCLLGYLWQHQCKIIPDYMPPHPREDTRPRCVVKFVYKDGTETFMRYSKGPLQGYFWDDYGDDLHSPELALLALSQAPAPPRVGVVIPTHGT